VQTIELFGRTVCWSDKALRSLKDGVLEFEDGDRFNAINATGLHRYGMLSITGSSLIAHTGGTFTKTKSDKVYDKRFPAKR
jgi:hypothetical protein